MISVPDLLIAISAFGLSASLVPQIIDGFQHGAKVNLSTAATTTAFLFVIFVAFVMLDLILSIVAMGIEVVMWGILMWQAWNHEPSQA